MQIFITRGEDSSGPYTLEQVQDYLSQGVLFPDDLAYHEGLEGWIPLEQLIAKSVPLEEPPHPAQMAEETPPSKPEPVLAEVVRTPVKGKGKKKIVMAAVAGLLVLSSLSAGAWFLLKKGPAEQVQNQKPASPPPATGTPEPNPNLPPPPTTNPSNPEPTPSANSKLAEAIVNKRMVISFAGDEHWVQLNSNGTTLDKNGLTGTFVIEGLTVTIRDDDGASTAEFATSKPQPGDMVNITSRQKTNPSLVRGPIKAKLVKLTASESSEPPGPIPPLPIDPNSTLPLSPLPTEPTPPDPSESQPGADADSKAILEASIRKQLRKPEGEALTPGDLGKVTSVNVRAASRGPKVKDLTYLKNCPNLEGIFMQSHEVKDLSPLAGLTKLNKINLSRNQVTDLTPLAKLPALRELWVQSNGLENLKPLASIVTLQQLYLDENPLKDLGPLAGLSQLETLGLSGIQARDLSPLKGISSLQSLSFSPPVGTDFKAVLGGMQKLKSIHISKTKMQDLNGLVGALARPEVLESLTVFNGDVENIASLAKCQNLRSVSMMANGITDLSAFKGMTQLTSLILSQNKVSDVTALIEVPNLTTLWLSSNRVTDIMSLMKHKKLRFVLLRASQVPEEQLEQLRQAIPGCQVNNKTAKK